MPTRRRASSSCCARRAGVTNWSRSCRSAKSRWRSCTFVVRVDPASQPAGRGRAPGARNRRRRWSPGATGCAPRCARDSASAGARACSSAATARHFPPPISQDVDAAQAVRRHRRSGRNRQPPPERMQLRLYRPAAAAAAARAPAHHPPRRGAVDLRRAADIRALRSARHRRASLPAGMSPMAASAWMQDFELEHYIAATRRGRRGWRDELIAAFRAIRAGELDDDGFNRLLIAAELGMRQVTVLRACCRYLLQTGIPFSQSYMERVLATHMRHRARPVRAVRTAPDARRYRAPRGRARHCSSSALRRAIAAVVSPDEDRILRAFLADDPRDAAHQLLSPRCRRACRGPWLSLKLDPGRIPGLPQPRPAVRDLRARPAGRGRAPARRANRARRHPLVGAARGFPHRDSRPDEGAARQEHR